MTEPRDTIGRILAGAEAGRPAFLAPGRDAMSYADLANLVAGVGAALGALGIGRQDRVAVVLPNGPEAASAFLAVANCAVAAPLNPSYTVDEFAFYMQDLSIKLLLCMDADGAAAHAARKAAIPVVTLKVRGYPRAGEFSLDLPEGGICSATNTERDDICLVLHTSGTTSRPKIVPLSHANVSASARNISGTLMLTPDDVCLNIMPLFHIHGLIAAVMSSLAAGGSIYFSPGFNAMKVFSWFEDARPSWYTAVPTMHQAILARAPRNRAVVRDAKLRFIRSSSSSLPPQVMSELESLFGCPVVEAYGMTEAAHQMAANPIMPGAQKPGSVGPAAGPEVAILESGTITTQSNVLGEIVIKGENVTSGYEANEKANAESFVPDSTDKGVWFRTGDQGRLDADGYLFITGRLKEIINRGGEKISPREVDEVLMDHDAVEQAVTFALPHPQLGEEVAAAVVLKEGRSTETKTLRDFVSQRLAGFKVPRRILILDEIPKGPTGKLQRIGLAEKLGLTGTG